MNCADILEYLQKRFKVCFDIDSAIKDVKKEKEKYKNSKNETTLFECWYILEFLQIISAYKKAFSLLKQRKYYESWCIFEQIEIKYSNLHFNNVDYQQYRLLAHIEEFVKKWQGLYPYKVFCSPEYIIKKKECSICGKEQNPFSGCKHIAGKIYGGEMCYSIVKDIDFLALALVTNPDQKYSAVYFDMYNPKRYEVLEYFVPRIKDEYEAWRYEISFDYAPHSMYKLGRNEICPCGSGEKYKNCCLQNPLGVKYLHYELIK